MTDEATTKPTPDDDDAPGQSEDAHTEPGQSEDAPGQEKKDEPEAEPKGAGE